MRSHQINIWNAEADYLADKGRLGNEGWSDSPVLPSTENVPKIDMPSPCLRAHCISEAQRVNRALHAFATLCLPLIPKTYLAGRVAKNHDEILNKIGREQGDVSEKIQAIIKINTAKDLLLDPVAQQKEGLRLLGNKELTAPVIYEIKDCPIDIEAMTRFAASTEADIIPYNKHGESYRLSYRELIMKYIDGIKTVTRGKKIRGSVHLIYRHKGIGAELTAMGFLTGARVYADTPSTDPFSSLPKKVRYIALAKYGVDLDDDASHTRAAVDLTHIW